MAHHDRCRDARSLAVRETDDHFSEQQLIAIKRRGMLLGETIYRRVGLMAHPSIGIKTDPRIALPVTRWPKCPVVDVDADLGHELVIFPDGTEQWMRQP